MTDASGALILGGVVFSGFEVPEELPFGGHQKHIEHQMIGGTRVIDAMGPSPMPIGWRGRFRGQNALSRAQILDAMRKAGAQMPLMWGGLYYTVLITHFCARPQKFYEVPYEIECVVCDDPSLGGISLGSVVSTLSSLVRGDMASLGASLGGVVVSLGF